VINTTHWREPVTIQQCFHLHVFHSAQLNKIDNFSIILHQKCTGIFLLRKLLSKCEICATHVFLCLIYSHSKSLEISVKLKPFHYRLLATLRDRVTILANMHSYPAKVHTSALTLLYFSYIMPISRLPKSWITWYCYAHPGYLFKTIAMKLKWKK